MKLLYSILLCLLAYSANSAPVIQAIANGKWNQAATWDLNRKPQDGDTVIISFNREVVLDINETLNSIVLKITGTFRLNNGKLNLNASSRIDIMPQGRLSGNGNNDQVKIGNDFKFRGGIDNSILGPAYADNSTGISPNGFNGGFALLNATLTGFTVKKVNNEVHVSWIIAPGNTLRFEIEKSTNGSSWAVIASIPVAAAPQYSYIDKNPGAMAYYRIRQVFATGIAYTPVKVVNANTSAIHIYAAEQTVHVRLNEPISYPVSITVMDTNGRIVQRLMYHSQEIDFKVNKGKFIVQVCNAAGAQKSVVVIL